MITQVLEYDPDDPLGVDLRITDDLDPAHQLESGLDLLKHDILHRIQTPRGMNVDDPDYGIDVREEILSRPLSRFALATIPRRIEAEIRKDERVESVVVTLTMTGYQSCRIEIRGLAGAGPFELVADVTQAGVLILAEQEG